MPAGLAVGAAASTATTVLLTALMAKLMESETLQENAMGYGIMIVLVLSSFLGAVLSYGRIKRQRLIVCVLSAILYFMILISITALFFGGQYSGVGVTALMIICGAGLAILPGFPGEKGAKNPKIRIRNR
jgi:putative membrane protein (TIGR04086 family)